MRISIKIRIQFRFSSQQRWAFKVRGGHYTETMPRSHANLWEWLYTCKLVRVVICMQTYKIGYIHANLWDWLYSCMCVCVCVCGDAFRSVHIYAYVCMYVCTCVRAYVHSCGCVNLCLGWFDIDGRGWVVILALASKNKNSAGRQRLTVRGNDHKLSMLCSISHEHTGWTWHKHFAATNMTAQ